MLVTVGTDHHPFERLISWAERWARRAPDWQVVVQHGRTRAPSAGEAVDFIDHDRLQQLLAASDVVVTHGGPATITEARRFGHRPIVVARDPRLGEHVDDHQKLFVRRLATAGLIEPADTEDDFLACVVTVSYLPRQRTADEGVPPGVYRVGAVIEELARRNTK